MNTELERVKSQRKTDKKDYTTTIVPLNFPLDGIASVTIRPPTLIEDVELSDSDGNRDELELVALVTGLDINQVEKIKRPDWNNIVKALNKFLTETSYKIAKKRYKPKDMKITLLFTEKQKDVYFRMPTVFMTRKGDKISNTTERLKFYLAQITELSKDEIENMPLPDYKMLDQVVSDFLFREAEYFQ